MRTCVLTEGSPVNASQLPECDLLVVGFQGLGEVDYESELKGKTEKFEVVAKLSKKYGCAAVCGCKTNSRGMFRKSAAVFDGGKLIAITDMNCVMDKEDFKGGAGLSLFDLRGYKVGVLIENDLLFPENFQALSNCGCNLAVCIMETVTDSMPATLMRAYSYAFGVPVVACGGKVAYFADVTGEIATSFQGVNVFELSSKAEYHLVTVRRRGLCRKAEEDY